MNHQGQADPGWIGALLAGAVGAIVSLPAMLLVLALIPVARWRRAAMFIAALVGLGVTVLCGLGSAARWRPPSGPCGGRAGSGKTPNAPSPRPGRMCGCGG